MLVLCGAPPAAAAAPLEGSRAQYSLKLTVSMARDQQTMGVFPITGSFSVDFGRRDWQGGHKVEVRLDELKLPEPMAGAQADLGKLLGKKLTLQFDKRGRLVDVVLPGLPLGRLLEEQGQLPYPRTQDLRQSLKAMPAGTTVSVRTAIPAEDGGEPLIFTMDFEHAGLSEDGQDYVLRFKADGDARALAARGAAGLGGPSSLPPGEPAAVAQMMGEVAFGMSLNGTLRVNAEHGLPSRFDLEVLLATGKSGEGVPGNVGLSLSVKLESLTPLKRS